VEEDKIVIAFDLPGVLLTNSIPLLISAMAKRGGAWSPKAMMGWYRQALEQDLFAGNITSSEFWEELIDKTQVPEVEKEQWQQYFFNHTQPLLDHPQLFRWCEKADLAIVANGLPEWYANPLRATGIHRLASLRHTVLSTQYGIALPDQALFEVLHINLGEPEPAVLYISADEEHGEAVEDYGWGFLQADPEGLWMWEVDDYLNLEHPDPLEGLGSF
jgi:FMN phosphatase YigB (HAD superfamily)